jgi:hypothetical protein
LTLSRCQEPEFPLQPKAEQVIELGYEVRFPRGQMVGGLE